MVSGCWDLALAFLVIVAFFAVMECADVFGYNPNSKHIKFIYSEKAAKFCEIFPLLLTAVHTVKSKRKISQNFVAFSEYMNFTM